MSQVLHNINKFRRVQPIVFEIRGQRWLLFIRWRHLVTGLLTLLVDLHQSSRARNRGDHARQDVGSNGGAPEPQYR